MSWKCCKNTTLLQIKLYFENIVRFCGGFSFDKLVVNYGMMRCCISYSANSYGPEWRFDSHESRTEADKQ